MNLSWFDNAGASTVSDLAEQETILNQSSLTKIFWVRNNGTEGSTESLKDFGFYISAPKLDDLNKILIQGQSADQDDLPYGLFVVFGYESNDGMVSYIDEFLANGLTAEVMRSFQVNWNQGCSPLNKIRLNNAFTYRQTGYGKNSTLPIYFQTSENSNNECHGKVKVLVAFRAPATTTLVSDFDLQAHASNGDVA